jgi:DNA-binding PadR family transcriptional regulator
MKRNQTNLLQGTGTLDLLILKAIGKSEMEGLDVARSVERITSRTFQVMPDPFFRALDRMEEAGWLSSVRGDSENNRHPKFYRRTRAGELQLGIEIEK